MRRRDLLAGWSAALSAASLTAGPLPANKNVKWALSLALWMHFKPTPIESIFDIMKDTGFMGVRLIGNPQLAKNWNTTPAIFERELSKRKLRAAAIAFSGPLHVPDQRKKVLDDARASLEILKGMGGKHMVLFSPGRLTKPGVDVKAAFGEVCERANQIGELAGSMGMTVGLHNHLDQMVEQQREIDRLLNRTDAKLVGFSPDTAHLHLAGINVLDCLTKHKSRLRGVFDYKDARWTTPTADLVEDNGRVYKKDSRQARFLSSIYDLGDGEINFPACHELLKSIEYKGWLCVDLDTARQGPRKSYERCGGYIVSKLEPIYK
jgi:sugar phosphate isomerase/epimerase